jgi:ABC-type transport system involved in cytochrome c biogenesis permease component
MFGLSFASLPRTAQPLAIPGMLWLAVAFVGALTLTRIFDREREFDTLRVLLTAPVERLAIYLAKAAVTLVVLLGCCAVLVPGLAFLFPAAGAFAQRPGATAVLVVLGCTSYAAVGTLFAAGLCTSSGKNVLLSVILYPLTSPSLMWSLVCTRALLEGHPELPTYLAQLAALDVVLVVLAGWLFESVLVGPGRPRPSAPKATSTKGRPRPSAPKATSTKGRPRPSAPKATSTKGRQRGKR